MTEVRTDGPYCVSCGEHRAMAPGGKCPLCLGPACNAFRDAPIRTRCMQTGPHDTHKDSLGRSWT